MAGISDEDRNELRRLREKVDTISGPGVTNTRRRVCIDVRSVVATPKPRRPKDQMFIVRVLDDAVTFTPASGSPTTINLGGGKYLGKVLGGAPTALTTTAQLEATSDWKLSGMTHANEILVAEGDAIVWNLAEDLFSSSHNLVGVTSLTPFVMAYDTGTSMTIVANPGATNEASRTFRVMTCDTLRTQCQ